MYQVEILEQAQIDVQDTSDYYKNVSSKLRDRFLKELKISLKLIQKNPKAFQIKYKEIRVNFVKGFPFGIYFKIYVKQVKVLAILHTSRNPKIWKNRE